MRTTYMAKPNEVEKKWYVVDAAGKPLGRVASQVAALLRGKNKQKFTPNVDCGDYVIVINASKVSLSGNKLENKNYYNHSGFPGGMRVRTAKTMVEKYPEEMLERAIWGMIPKGRLGRQIYKKLYVFANETHDKAAQKPEALEIKGL